MASRLCTSSSVVESQNADGFSWAKTLMAHGASWAKDLRNEYYDGDIDSLNGDDELDLVTHREISSPCPVSLVTSRRRYVFRRSWNHIRSDKEDIIELRFVRNGTFAISQAGNTYTVNPGQFVFTRSKVPFRWESLAPDQTLSEYCFVLFPPDLVYHHFPEGVPLNTCLPAQPSQSLAMPTILSLLCAQGAGLSHDVTKLLFTTLLKEAGVVAKEQGALVDPRKNVCDKRIEDIIAYIDLHLFNPDVSLSSVARACGISPRYLCYLLKMKGASFSDLLWEERLKKARERLIALDAKHYPISEIAFMTGFKTAAHFSRLFRNRYGCSPRELRGGS